MNQHKEPFAGSPHLIFHGTYHKMGTVWLMRVLEKVASTFNLKLQKSNQHGDHVSDHTDILFANHSHFQLETLRDFVGSHMIRDPRDSVVSGYFYHLWTDEAWVHVPQAQYDGLSYQAHLKSVSQNAGLQEEIRRFSRYVDDYGLRQWNYDDDRIFEIKYETLLADEPTTFRKLFAHYGFSEAAIETSVRLASECSFKKVSGRSLGQSNSSSHLRSGKPGQWKDVLNAAHVDAIKEQFGDLILSMGYEKDSDWPR